MKKVLLFAAVVAAGILAPRAGNAQTNNVFWAKHYGGIGGATAQAVTTDASGNIYCTGYFNYGLTLDNVTLTSAGNADILVKKTDAGGNVLWAKNFGGAGNDFGFDIAVDGSGNVYVAGTFRGTATIGTTSMTSVDLDDILVIKIDGSSGSVVWAKGFGTVGDDGAQGIAVDATGNIYITGYYGNMFTGGSAVFGSTTLTSAGGRDAFVTKLNSVGDVQWAKSFGGAIADEGYSIALNSAGDLYFTGKTTSTSKFGPVTLSSSGLNDAFVAKLNGSGDVQWAKNFGGTDADAGRKIVVDNSDKIYASGIFFGTAGFDTHSFISAGNADMFLMRLDATGAIDWVKQYGGSAYDDNFGLAIEGSSVFMSGMIDGAASFDATTLTSFGASDAFAAKVNGADGNLAWATNFGGAGNEYGRAITGDGNGNAILYGEHNSEFAMGKDTLKHYKGRNFLAKISGAVSTGGFASKSSDKFELYPNPADDHISITGTTAANICVLNAFMQLQPVAANGNMINISGLPPGVYYIYATQGGTPGMARFVRQ